MGPKIVSVAYKGHTHPNTSANRLLIKGLSLYSDPPQPPATPRNPPQPPATPRNPLSPPLRSLQRRPQAPHAKSKLLAAQNTQY